MQGDSQRRREQSTSQPALPPELLPHTRAHTHTCTRTRIHIYIFKTYCAESPAGAALLLVLDGGDVALVPPVHGGRQVSGLRLGEEG